MISFSCKRHSDCQGITVSELLDINTNNYCDLIEKSLAKNKDALKEISLLSIYDSASYEHGTVLVQIIEKVGEDFYVKSLGVLTSKEKNKIKSYLDVGLEYGGAKYKDKALKKFFPKVEAYLVP